MRIAVWHNLPSGGGKRALYDHVRGLVGRGHTVESWCPPTANQNYLPLSDLVREHIVPARPRPPRSAYTPANIINLKTSNLLKFEEVDGYCRACAAEINRGDFDLLFANSSIEVAVATIGRYVRLPKVLYLQEPERFLYEAGDAPLPWVAPVRDASARSLGALKDSILNSVRVRGLRIQAREEWLSAKAFDTLLVNSYFSRESVMRVYGIDAKVCYLGVDTGKFVNLNLPRENFVVGVGAIAPRKNIRLVIEALARIPAGGRPRLVWIGDAAVGSHLAELRQLAAGLRVELEQRVGIDDAMLVELLNRARLMVYTPRLEPFGYAPLEANACGTPVVAVAEGGVKETIIDGVNGLLVDHEPEAVAAGVMRLMEDGAEAERLGRNGQRVVGERWSIEAAVARLEKRLEETLAAAARPDV
jgi:glycosyltransferase involved in cell wall biosynthesis